jgi:hypothetical protein
MFDLEIISSKLLVALNALQLMRPMAMSTGGQCDSKFDVNVRRRLLATAAAVADSTGSLLRIKS